MKLFLIIATILYAISPVDLLPEALLGGWGWIEDLVLLFILWNYLRGGGNPLGMFRYGRQQRPGQNAGPNRDSDWHNASSHSNGHPNEHRASRNPYLILGVSEQSSLEEIKTAYRDQAAKYHPDKVQHLGEEFQQLAEIRFKEIQEAYRRIREERSNL